MASKPRMRHHSKPGERSSEVYSWDAMAPVRQPSKVLADIRAIVFVPAASGSRFFPYGAPLSFGVTDDIFFFFDLCFVQGPAY